MATAVVALALIASTTVLFASLQQAELTRRELLAGNAYAARVVASTVLLQLEKDAEAFQVRRYADQAQHPAQDPALLALLEGKRYEALTESPLPIGVAMPRGLSAFESWLVLDETGVIRARWPKPPAGNWPTDFSQRDVFVGARALAWAGKRTVHVSHVFQDEVSGHAAFAFSTPMFGSDGIMVGVIAALVSPGTAFSTIPLNFSGDPNRSQALVGPRDGSSDYVFLSHDGLEPGQLVAFDSRRLAEPRKLRGTQLRPIGEQLRPADPTRTGSTDHYLDPVPGYAGRWLSGMAPVGDTAFVVIVQTRYAAVLEPILHALNRIALLLLASLLVLLGVNWSRHRNAGAH